MSAIEGEYVSRQELDDVLAELRKQQRRNSEPADNGGGRGDAPLTRAELRRELSNFRDEVEDDLRRASRRGVQVLSDSDRAAIAAAVCDELDSRYISDLDEEEADAQASKRSSKGNGKAKAGAKPAKGAEPDAEKPPRRWGGLFDD